MKADNFKNSIPTAALVQRLGEACKAAVGAELTVHVKAKADDGGKQMDDILSVLKDSDPEPCVGVLTKVRQHQQV